MGLLASPEAVAIASIVSDDETVTGTLYADEFVFGAVPFVVK